MPFLPEGAARLEISREVCGGPASLGGRSGGEANLEEFTERRWLTLNPGPVHYPY
jgi:hypothetical protein